MNENLLEVVFILDRSGSMEGLEKDTIGGFNSMLAKQKKNEGEAVVTTVLFDHEMLTLHDRVKIQEVRPMTEDDYQPRGCTALMDAVGETMEKVRHLQKHLRAEDRPGKTLCCIITDGFENASTRYCKADIKKMITEAQDKENWEFVFLGANIDAAAEAEGYGISRDYAVKYCADERGTLDNFEAVGSVMCCMRAPAIDRTKRRTKLKGIMEELQEKNDR